MRILQIINNLTSGGAEKLLVDLILTFKENDHEVEVLLLSDKNNVYKDILTKEKIKITVLSNNKYNPTSIIKIRRFIKRNNFEIIHSHLFPVQYYTAFACIGLQRSFSLVTTEHSTNNKRRGLWIFKLIEKFIYSRYNTIICISQESKNQLQNHIGLNTRIQVISNGVFLKV